MSFIVDIEVRDLTDELGHAVEARCAGPEHWPVTYAPPRARRLVVRPPSPGRLWVPRCEDLLTDEADTGEEAWDFEPVAARRFAASVGVLGAELPQGFRLRATWVGSPIRSVRHLSVDELADLTRASLLNEFTHYIVGGSESEVSSPAPH